jgi:hypothetical protein
LLSHFYKVTFVPNYTSLLTLNNAYALLHVIMLTPPLLSLYPYLSITYFNFPFPSTLINLSLASHHLLLNLLDHLLYFGKKRAGHTIPCIASMHVCVPYSSLSTLSSLNKPHNTTNLHPTLSLWSTSQVLEYAP